MFLTLEFLQRKKIFLIFWQKQTQNLIINKFSSKKFRYVNQFMSYQLITIPFQQKMFESLACKYLYSLYQFSLRIRFNCETFVDSVEFSTQFATFLTCAGKLQTIETFNYTSHTRASRLSTSSQRHTLKPIKTFPSQPCIFVTIIKIIHCAYSTYLQQRACRYITQFASLR